MAYLQQISGKLLLIAKKVTSWTYLAYMGVGTIDINIP
jgi:hypothetical protein